MTQATDYVWHEARGADVVADRAWLAALANVWAQAYRASHVPAQALDPLFGPERGADRLRYLSNELSLPSARVVYVTQQGELVGFFWGLALADLEVIAASKAAHCQPYVKHSPERVAYLSMLGVRAEHAGHGLAKQLVTRLAQAFCEAGAAQAVARTINETAWRKVYQPLGFVEHERFADPQARNTTRVVFGAPLPLAPSPML
ncbi:MAG: hypothetical protein RL701_1172 [Pseudomonadota bacterium]